MDHSETWLTDFSFTRQIRPDQFTLRSRKIMIALSHAIEEQAAAGNGTVLIATFQRFSLLKPALERYSRFAARCASTFAIGIPDITLDSVDGLELLPIQQTWPLAQEWVVIASGPHCCGALLSRDADGLGPRRSQRFAGRWTTDSVEVDALLDSFYAASGKKRQPVRYEQRAMLKTAKAILQALAQALRT